MTTPNKGQRELIVSGFPPGTSAESQALCRARLTMAVSAFMDENRASDLRLLVGTRRALENAQRGAGSPSGQGESEMSIEDRAKQYESVAPLYTFDQLIVSDELREELLSAVEIVQVTPLVFGTWGLRKIEPFPRTALNFHGAPGTGKTMAAHAIANRLSRKVLAASYAEVESKYVGDGPKNIKALFTAAERDGAVLFIDEADSLLSRRLTNVTQGSEQAINSMRSQLLICLERFQGVVIFATNLVENYDKAFETRVRHVRFNLPNQRERQQIWAAHLVPTMPLREPRDALSARLAAEVDDICGRDIKNAVLDAAIRCARARRDAIGYEDLRQAILRIKAQRPVPASSQGSTVELTEAEKAQVAEAVRPRIGTPPAGR